MSKYLKYGILEDVDTVRRIPLGRFWGVTLTVTPITWLSPFVFFGLQLALNAFIFHPSLIERLTEALIFMIAVELATVFHAFGHILSGKLIHSAMDELLTTATRDVNLYYGDQSLVPSHVHIVRSLGGPVFNLFTAGIFSLLVPIFASGFWSALLAKLISINLFLGIGSFLPLPSVDGQVIWRELLRPKRDSKRS